MTKEKALALATKMREIAVDMRILNRDEKLPFDTRYRAAVLAEHAEEVAEGAENLADRLDDRTGRIPAHVFSEVKPDGQNRRACQKVG
jgi:hypothetical protein